MNTGCRNSTTEPETPFLVFPEDLFLKGPGWIRSWRRNPGSNKQRNQHPDNKNNGQCHSRPSKVHCIAAAITFGYKIPAVIGIIIKSKVVVFFFNGRFILRVLKPPFPGTRNIEHHPPNDNGKDDYYYNDIHGLAGCLCLLPGIIIPDSPAVKLSVNRCSNSLHPGRIHQNPHRIPNRPN